ncbi:MAG TPA: exosortase/archaeosortase family protein [Methylomirabilota bacterium]|nr:exosortase/archaeosortase family protein [Methylomirabilota bacterium]
MACEIKDEAAKSALAGQGFAAELRELGRAIPHKGLFSVLLLAWLALFHFLGNGTFGYINTPSLFGWLQNIYNYSPDDESLGILIPILILGLLWWKRNDLASAPKHIWWPALILFGFAAALHVVGYVVQQQRVSLVALFLGLYGLMGVLWGWSWLKVTFFPLFLLAFLVPLPMDLEGMTLPLRLVSTKIAVTISHVLGIGDVAQHGARISHPVRQFGYDVEAACSGLRSLTVMTAMSCVFAFITFRSNWKRLVVIASAVPLAIASNSLRLLSIIIGGNWKYDQLRAAGMPLEEVRQGAQNFGSYIHEHTIIKLVPYAIGFLCLMLLAKWLRDDVVDAPAKGTS